MTLDSDSIPGTGSGTASDAASGTDAHPAPAPAPASGPIFVDASGRRRKLARRASVGAVAVLAGYAGLLAVSFAGGPIPPNALLPVPGVPSGRQQAPASSAPAAAAPSGTSASDHAAAGGRSGAGGPEHRGGTRTGTSGGPVGQSAPSQAQPTSSATAPPTPTGTSGATTPTGTRGNPSAPGHTRHKTPSPT